MANFPRYDGHLYIDAYSGNIVRDFTIGTTLGIGSNATVGGTLGVTGATTLSSTLGVTGATTLSSTLGVTGITTLSAALGVTGNATVTGDILGTGDITRTGDITLTNTTTGVGGITVNSTDALGDSELNLTTVGSTFKLFNNQDGNSSVDVTGALRFSHGGLLNSTEFWLGQNTNTFDKKAFEFSTTSASGDTVTKGAINFNPVGYDIDISFSTDNVTDLVKFDGANDTFTLKPQTLPSTPSTGTLAIDSGDSNKLKFYNGSSWTDTSGGGGGGTSWQTTAKTADFTAVAGEGYFVNTNGGAITMTLPASPSAGDEVKVVDYSGDFNTNNLTITSASENIRGSSVDYTVNLDRAGISLVYSDATQGWQVFSYAKEEAINGAAFVAATGGTITTDGDYKVHTFNSSGTFTITDAGDASGSNTFDVLIVAGGGGGGSINSAGGGAGGLNYQTGVSAVAQAYTVTIGAGGTGGGPGDINTGTPLPTNGNDTDFTGQTSAVGGGRAGQNRNAANVAGSPYRDGGNGGSGGGAGEASGAGTPGTGTVGQGNDGGQAAGSPQYPGGGGGGAGAVGGNAASSGPAGNGGNGLSNSITGSATDYAGGGGAGARTSVVAGVGGTGGGGAGAAGGTNPGISGTTNLGGGGGGAGMNTSSPYFSSQGGNGGSGVVIVRYKFQ